MNDNRSSGAAPAPQIARMIGLLGDAGDTPLYQRLFQRIRQLIVDGALVAGTRLPASRFLADGLGISRNSVIQAFDQLAADGWVEARRGSGVYVSFRPPASNLTQGGGKAREISATAVPFAPGVPALDLFPIEIWNRLQSRRWRQMPRSALHEGHGAGWAGLRDAIASYLAINRGLRCSGEQVVVTTSVRASVDLAVRALGLAGEAGWVEDPGYFGFKDALRANGVRLIPAPVDEDGLDVEAAMHLAPTAKLAVVTPACHFPTGVELSAVRRAGLAAWAADTGAWIIEDDHDAENRFEGAPPPPLASAAPQTTIYLNSFNRLLFPALRIAFMVLPEHLVDVFARARGALDGHSNVPNQMVTADFITTGQLDVHLRHCRAAYFERRAALLEAAARELAGRLVIHPRAAGLQAVATLTSHSEAEAAALARARGVEITGMRRFLETPTELERAVLGFAGFTPSAIYRAVTRLGEALG